MPSDQIMKQRNDPRDEFLILDVVLEKQSHLIFTHNDLRVLPR